MIWLCEMTGKAILKLDAARLRRAPPESRSLARYGNAGPLNGEVFNALGAKIRGQEQAARRASASSCFSPHPDDDVISMGGILRKLHQNDNDIIVAYMTCGNIAVFDHDVRRYVDFLRRFGRDFDIERRESRRADRGGRASSSTRSSRARSTSPKCRTSSA